MFDDIFSVLSLLFGIGAVVFGLLSYQFNKHTTIMTFMILLSLMWSLHYAFLGLFTPVAINAVNIVRCFVYSQRSKGKFDSPITPAIFAVASVVLGIATYQSPASLLPMLAGTLTAISTWQLKAKNLRLLSLPVQTCWFVYDIINLSLPGITNDILCYGSIITAMIRHDFRKQNTKENDR